MKVRNFIRYALVYFSSHLLKRGMEFVIGFQNGENSFRPSASFFDAKILEKISETNQNLMFPYIPERSDPHFMDGFDHLFSTVSCSPLFLFGSPSRLLAGEELSDAVERENELKRNLIKHECEKEGIPFINNMKPSIMLSMLDNRKLSETNLSDLREKFGSEINSLPHLSAGINKKNGNIEFWFCKNEKGEKNLLYSADWLAGDYSEKNARILANRIVDEMNYGTITENNEIFNGVDKDMMRLLDDARAIASRILDANDINWIYSVPCRSDKNISIAFLIDTQFLEKLPFLNENERRFAECYNILSRAMTIREYAPEDVSLPPFLSDLLNRFEDPAQLYVAMMNMNWPELLMLSFTSISSSPLVDNDFHKSYFSLGVSFPIKKSGKHKARMGLIPILPRLSDAGFILPSFNGISSLSMIDDAQYASEMEIDYSNLQKEKEKIEALVKGFLLQKPGALF